MYGKKAADVVSELQGAFADHEIVTAINESKPRSKSFEVSVRTSGAAEPAGVWSGVTKGPPRALKFPEPGVITDLVKAAIAKKA